MVPDVPSHPFLKLYYTSSFYVLSLWEAPTETLNWTPEGHLLLSLTSRDTLDKLLTSILPASHLKYECNDSTSLAGLEGLNEFRHIMGLVRRVPDLVEVLNKCHLLIIMMTLINTY